MVNIREEVLALKRERIISVAVDLFYEHGYENANLEAVAKELGVTKPFIYSYFKSKTDLLAEICSRGIASSLEAIDSVSSEPEPASKKLRALGRKFTIAVLHNQKHIAIFSREEKNLLPVDYERISEMRREFDRKLTFLLDEGVRLGEFQISDTRLASLAIGGLVSWAYVWYRPHGRLDMNEVADQISQLILTMVRAKESAPAARELPATRTADPA